MTKISKLRTLALATILIAGTIGLIAGTIGAAMAQSSSDQRREVFNDWQTFSAGSGNSKMCVALSFPKEIQPEGLNRGDIAILVSHQLEFQDFDVLQIKLGYPLEEGRPVKINIDGRQWDLFPDAENAWPISLEDNAAILRAMKAGQEMYVEGRSQLGNMTMDRYSLRGISAALRSIDIDCGR